MKRIIALLLTLILVAGFAAVPASATEEMAVTTAAEASSAASAATIPDASEMFTDRDKDPEYDECVTVTLADGASAADGSGVTVAGNVITVTKEGTYVFTGTLSDGQIVVNIPEEDKVQIVLSDAHVTRVGGAALYILEGDKIFLTLDEGTENTLASTGEFVQTDDNTVDGAVFAKSDITLNGTGTALVSCETGHGVVAKDDLKITGGVWTVDAYAKGLEANDSLRMAGGDVTVISGADGVQVENEDLTRGYVYVGGGTLTVDSVGDCVSATGVLSVQGGTMMLTATGTVDSAKGLKSDSCIEVAGGDMTLYTTDDAIHTNGDVFISGGNMVLYTGDDAIHADNNVEVTGGRITAPACYEGLEGTSVTISGGYVSVVSTDDGINAGGGVDGSGFGGRSGSFAVSGSAVITVSGGEIHVSAEGDGLDSNGSLYITGGQVYVNGPSTSFNGTLDCDGAAVITGGVVVTTGPSSWLTNFGTSSTQGSILCTFTGYYGAGTEIMLVDNVTGEVILSYTAEKYFQSVILSAPELVVGGSYTVTAGEESQTIDMTSLQYGGGMGGMGGKSGRSGKFR